MDQTETVSLHLNGIIINRCIHCMTYCVITIDDIHRALKQGGLPQIKCHHCQRLFSPGPDFEIKPSFDGVDIKSAHSTTVTKTNSLITSALQKK